MLNQVVIAGRLTSDPIVENENDKRVCKIVVAVPRSYKNVNGEYDTDFIPCTLWQGIADTTAEYCKKGDIVGVKGRLMSEKIIGLGNIETYTIRLIAEKVSFLSSARNNEE